LYFHHRLNLLNNFKQFYSFQDQSSVQSLQTLQGLAQAQFELSLDLKLSWYRSKQKYFSGYQVHWKRGTSDVIFANVCAAVNIMKTFCSKL
jgi:hypothetical protein